MAEIVKCFKCKGKGTLRTVDWLGAVCSLGILALMGDSVTKRRCDACGGRGFLR